MIGASVARRKTLSLVTCVDGSKGPANKGRKKGNAWMLTDWQKQEKPAQCQCEEVTKSGFNHFKKDFPCSNGIHGLELDGSQHFYTTYIAQVITQSKTEASIIEWSISGKLWHLALLKEHSWEHKTVSDLQVILIHKQRNCFTCKMLKTM